MSDEELLKRIDEIMPQCGEVDCPTCTARHTNVLQLISQHNTKMLEDFAEYVIGDGQALFFKGEIPLFINLEKYMAHVVEIREAQRKEQRQRAKEYLNKVTTNGGKDE